MRSLPPCNQCQDRRVGCHDPAVCARWAAYDEANRAFREACRADWERRDVVGDYVRAKRSRMIERGEKIKRREKC